MKILFLDESGDHSLEKIDPQYPIFVLAGVVMDAEYHDGEGTRLMSEFKTRVFGSEEIILHTADITRNRGGFDRLKESEFREKFYQGLNRMMEDIRFKVIAVAIRKVEHLKSYGLAALDPYLLSLECIVERFIFELQGENSEGMIVAECRNSILDNELELAFLNLKIQGTRYIRAIEVKNRVRTLTTRRKEENIAGLQIADLVASPIGRDVLGKPPKPDIEIIRQKFRRSRAGVIEGYGLVTLPKIQRPGPATQFPAQT